MRGRYFISLCVMALILSSGAAFAGSISISVDASKPLGPMNPIYRDFAQGGESSDPDYLRPLIEPMRALKPRLIRFDHILNNYLKVEVVDGKLNIDFAAVDKQLDIIRAMGAQPLMCLSYTPKALGGDKSVLDPPKDHKLWIELIYRLVRHVNVERKLGVEYWELWNEPNGGSFWNGSMEGFLDLYSATEKAVLRADSTVKFGGAGYYLFPKQWVRAMMEHAKANNLHMDFISWHDYWDAGYDFLGSVSTARAWLNELGMKAELIIDEWNHDSALNPGNDDENGAVYIADLLCKMTEAGLDHTAFFEIKDGSGDKRYWGRWGLFTSDNHPKAAYNAFVGFSRMRGDRLLFTGAADLPGKEVVNKGRAKVGGMAVGSSRQLSVVLYNTSKEQDQSVDLSVLGLSKPALKARVFLIDKTHSNPALQDRDTGLEQVDEQALRPRDDVSHIIIALPKRSVVFVYIN